MTTSMKSPEAHLAVMAVRGIGGKGARKLIERFASVEEMTAAPDEAFKGVVNQGVRDRLRDGETMKEALVQAYRSIELARRMDARIVTRFDTEYPARLAASEDNPLILYVKGDLSSLPRSVACVGTRHPSNYGAVVADRLTGVLADAGYAIVSGLAIGVDSISHRAALRHGVPTIAIVGSGLDMIGHGERGALAAEILDAGGAVFSEQPFGTQNDPGTLIRRNRLQSGSSLATFIMQCGRTSGTMHTMRYAVWQGRPIYAPIPPEAYRDEPESEGVMLLASCMGRDLATSIEIKDDLQEIMLRDYGDRPVVKALRGRDDYPRMLEELEAIQPAEMAIAP